MRKIVLVFGLISGFIMSGLLAGSMLLPDATHFEHGMLLGYASMVLAGLLIYFGIRQYRDTVAGGAISFGKACQVGALIALVASCCYVITWDIEYRTYASGYITSYNGHQLEQARAGGASETELAAQEARNAKFAQMYENPFIRAAFTFLEPLPVALIMVLASAALLRRKNGSTPAIAPA